jgi:hypothetical protein
MRMKDVQPTYLNFKNKRNRGSEEHAIDWKVVCVPMSTWNKNKSQ